MNLTHLLPARWTGNRNLVRSSEERPFLSLHREMNRLFDDFFSDFDRFPAAWNETASGMAPRVDISETETEVHVDAELPGMSEQDIDVTLRDGVLTIRGEKKVEEEKQEKNYHRIERSYGRFERSLLLPAEVDPEKVDAVFQKGVLHVTLAKSKVDERQKKITVKAAE